MRFSALQQYFLAEDFSRYTRVLIKEDREEEGGLHRDFKFQRQKRLRGVFVFPN